MQKSIYSGRRLLRSAFTHQVMRRSTNTVVSATKILVLLTRVYGTVCHHICMGTSAADSLRP